MGMSLKKGNGMNTLKIRRWLASALVLPLVAGACAIGGVQGPTVTVTVTLTPTVPTVTPSATVTPDATAVFPIFDGATGYVIGGVGGGQWLDAAATAALVQGEKRYRLFMGSSPTAEVAGTIVTVDNGGPCAYPTVSINPALTLPGSIGVAGDWDVTPRQPESLSLTLQAYQDAVSSVLTANGIAAPDVRLTGLLRVDLEGNSSDEVLISASRLAGFQPGQNITPGVVAGDYTLVAMRKVTGASTADTFPFILTAYPQEDIMAYPWLPTIMATLDLNGDGDLEIVVELKAFEGRLIEVYDVNGPTVTKVLTAGCSI
jgi:hypothetical protein